MKPLIHKAKVADMGTSPPNPDLVGCFYRCMNECKGGVKGAALSSA